MQEAWERAVYPNCTTLTVLDSNMVNLTTVGLYVNQHDTPTHHVSRIAYSPVLQQQSDHTIFPLFEADIRAVSPL